MATLPQLRTSAEPAHEIACDVLLIGAVTTDGTPGLAPGAEDVDQALDGHLSDLSAFGYRAGVGDTLLVPTLGKLPARVIAVVGLGDAAEAGAAEVRRAAGSAARRISSHADVVCLLHRALDADEGAASAAAEGLLLGSYTFSGYKQDPKPSKIQRVSVPGAATQDLERATARAEAVALARDLTNEPAGTLTPEILARRAQEVADVAGLGVEVLGPGELEAGGFGGILGVARGSRETPRLIHLRYVPEQAKGKVALVGKGITFDSGGLSLKDSKSMEVMKTDMAGAAAVLGVMSALPRLNPTVEVHGFIPTSENMPGGGAIRPGDVITHRGGRTTEVVNTDAEGRLILGDTLAYASEIDPDAIVDVATLTGAIMIALGRKATGVFSNNDDLRNEIVAAGDTAGERMWPMPLYDDYINDLESEVADLKNSGARWGSSIVAALFLQKFVDKRMPWAHLDIAGPARAENHSDEVTKGGTGIPTRTLLTWIENRAAQPR